eukprot:5328734-Prymnesium_polylepis.2
MRESRKGGIRCVDLGCIWFHRRSAGGGRHACTASGSRRVASGRSPAGAWEGSGQPSAGALRVCGKRRRTAQAVAEDHQVLVDRVGLVEPRAARARLLLALRSRQVDDAQPRRLRLGRARLVRQQLDAEHGVGAAREVVDAVGLGGTLRPAQLRGAREQRERGEGGGGIDGSAQRATDESGYDCGAERRAAASQRRSHPSDHRPNEDPAGRAGGRGASPCPLSSLRRSVCRLLPLSGTTSRSKASLPYTSRKEALTSYWHAGSSAIEAIAAAVAGDTSRGSRPAATSAFCSIAANIMQSARGSTPI